MSSKLFVATVLALAALAVAAQPAATPRGMPRAEASSRWQSTFDAFAAADRERSPRPDGVLFVGSSSIRLWEDLDKAFASEPVVTNRGFGGSLLSDCVDWVDRLVLPYKPRLVVLYAGDNDLAEGATPAEVARRFDAFVAAVRAALPDTRIAYISIKPEPLRAPLMGRAREANDLIAQRVQAGRNLDFIDIYSLMLGPDGQPRGELYASDRLHLNAAGYAVWRSAVAEHLGAGNAPTAMPAPSAPR